MKTTSQSQEIHDMIERLDLGSTPQFGPLIEILEAINRRMDDIEAASDRANHVASCLANGIQPD